MNSLEEHLRQLLQSLISRYAGAIEFWTVACLSRGDLGDPNNLIDSQWGALNADLQQFRSRLAELRHEPPPIVHEQIAKLMKLFAELRELFEVFLNHEQVTRKELELAVLKLGFFWKEIRLRISLIAAMTPLPAPLPGITLDQEAYYQSVLDGLFDRFATNAEE